MNYGQGKLADAIRAAIAHPLDFGEAAPPPGSLALWDGVEGRYALVVFGQSGLGWYWSARVEHRGEVPRADMAAWLARMAGWCLLGLGVGRAEEVDGLVMEGRNWVRWEKPCSPAEVREIEAATAKEVQR